MFIQAKTSAKSLDNICGILRERFAGDSVELFLTQKGGQVLENAGPLEEMLPLLRGYCFEFPEAIIRYEPEHPYGMICTIWCDCNLNSACELRCADRDSRPRAMLVLRTTPEGEQEVGASKGLTDEQHGIAYREASTDDPLP